MLKKLCLQLAIIGIATVAVAQDSDITFQPTELAPGVFMFEGQGGFAGGNLGLLTGEDGIVLIDDGIEPVSAMTVKAVESVTKAPVDFVINTHAHDDHTGANVAFNKRSTTILAHSKLRDRMIADNSPKAALPELTYDESVTFHLNGLTAHVFHVARAHTDGDSVIQFPEVNIVHTGDAMFNRLFPFIDLDSGGSVSGYIAAQQLILSMVDDETKIIPGHGKLASKADLQDAVNMLIDAQSRVQALIDAGRTLDQIQNENPLAAYHDIWNWDFISTASMTETLYRSITSN